MRTLLIALFASMLAAPAAQAQHEGHNMAAMDTGVRVSYHIMAQAIPLVTRAQPSAEGQTITEGALTQPLLMARARFASHLALDATLNFEGLTMQRGEINTGALGEGYVDRRHPHTYLHELVASADASAGGVRYSLSAGRGFAAFGTDDPMVRPLVKYPINHHLSQILERGEVVAAARAGRFILEGSSFGGDEPTSPSSLPRASRLFDSWSVRGTFLPASWAEAQASYAAVKSPEEPSGSGLDQRKQSASFRASSSDRSRYLLAEWARTRDHDAARGTDVFSYQSALAEGSLLLRATRLSMRIEQTERPEEDRLADPFRTPLPASDLSINGITRWRAVTFNVTAPPVTASMLSGFPFIEVERLYAAASDPRALFTPQRLYGDTRFWMLTAGMRLRIGEGHDRMGRYGVALP